MIHTIRATLVALLATLSGGSAQSMTLERVDDTLYATGPLVSDDFLAYQAQFAQAGLKRLVLVDSPGGDLWTALRVGEAVRDAGLDTVAVGSCLSACSVLFVAGKKRAYGTGRTPAGTFLGIHGGYNADSGKHSNRVGPALYAFFRRQLGSAMDDGLVNEAIYGLKDARGFLVLNEIERNTTETGQARMCLNLADRSSCKTQDGKDALSLGLVTQRASVALELPPSMRVRLQHFGEAVKDSPLDLAAWEQEVLPVMCPKGNCPEVTNFFKAIAVAPFHRAIAWNSGVAAGKPLSRMQAAGGSSTPQKAMFEALYGCNHRDGVPALCRLLAIDDQDLRPLQQRLEQQAQDTLAKLPEPSPATLAEEKTDFCSGAVSKRKPLEQGGYDTAPPCSLRGVERIDSGGLAVMLKDERRPVVVDVGMGDNMLPGAIALLGAGVSFDDDVKEVAYHQRFMGLVRAAAPDLAQPLVFYAGERGGWLSAHAALRAVQAGHTRVYWYRGGLPAWKAAGLPTVGKVALGVVY